MRNYFFTGIIGIHILFVLALLWRENMHYRTISQVQLVEKSLEGLKKKKRELLHEIAQLKSRSFLLKEAKRLGYVPLSLKHIQPLP